MSTPFDIVNNVLQSKEETEELSQYIPFIINKSLSYHYDCIMQANEMNMRHGLQNEMQYAFLYNSIRKYKRPFKKWHKKEKEESDVLLVKEYYNVSSIRAREILALLTKENLDEMREKMQKGGITK